MACCGATSPGRTATLAPYAAGRHGCIFVRHGKAYAICLVPALFMTTVCGELSLHGAVARGLPGFRAGSPDHSRQLPDAVCAGCSSYATACCAKRAPHPRRGILTNLLVFMDFYIASETRQYNFTVIHSFADGRARPWRPWRERPLPPVCGTTAFRRTAPIPIASPCNMRAEDVPVYLDEYRRIGVAAELAACRFYASMEVDYLGAQWGRPAITSVSCRSTM